MAVGLPSGPQAFKGYSLFQGYFSRGPDLIFIRGTYLALPGTKVSQTAGSACSLLSWEIF